jgi:NADH-quinone oxidoreductase subunit E
MLSPHEIAEIAAEARHYSDPRAVSIEALKIVQKHRGWVSDESLRELAEHLDISAADLDAVATFYNLIFRRRVGRHVIFVCTSVSCWIMGCEGIQKELKARLGIDAGGTTADDRFTVLPIPCLGACDHAPALLIDGDLHRDVDPARLGEILERYR